MTVPESLPLSLHPVDTTWVKQRAIELSEVKGHKRPDIKGALSEIAERYVNEVGDNLDESRDPVVYQSSEDSDPYIVAIPIKEALKAPPPPPAVEELPSIHRARPHANPTTIQEEFENVIFETEVGASLSELEKDANGRYVHSRVRLLWFGFNMYHQKMTQARRADFREDYHKPLGSYVVSKISETGGTLFTKVPVRFKTKAQGYEEAHRLQKEQGEAWGLWRCLDVIGEQDVAQEDSNE